MLRVVQTEGKAVQDKHEPGSPLSPRKVWRHGGSHGQARPTGAAKLKYRPCRGPRARRTSASGWSPTVIFVVVKSVSNRLQITPSSAGSKPSCLMEGGSCYPPFWTVPGFAWCAFRERRRKHRRFTCCQRFQPARRLVCYSLRYAVLWRGQQCILAMFVCYNPLSYIDNLS